MDLPPQTTDILLLRAGQLVTHPFPWVGDAECLCLRFRGLYHESVSLSSWWSWKHLTPQAFHSLQQPQTPLWTPELLWQSLEHIYVYHSSSLLHIHNFTLYPSFLVHFIVQAPLHHHPPATIKSHPFKSSGILKVLELKQAYQIQHAISILKLESLILRVIWREKPNIIRIRSISS